MSVHNQALIARAMEVLGNKQDALHRLETPKGALGNECPFEMAKTEEGKQKVLDLLARIEHGVFS
jgi:putative toxin-antitoxin system antitoxin component (TIGR02293 family)